MFPLAAYAKNIKTKTKFRKAFKIVTGTVQNKDTNVPTKSRLKPV